MAVAAIAILASLVLQIYHQEQAGKMDWLSLTLTFVTLVLVCLNIWRDKKGS